MTLFAGAIAFFVLTAADLYSDGWSAATSDWRRVGPWMSVAVFSVLAGSLMGVLMEFEKEKYEEALRGVDVADFKKVARAVERGHVPGDPGIRRAAARLAELYLGYESKSRWGSLFFYVLMIGLQVKEALYAADHDFMRPWGVVLPLLTAVALGVVAGRGRFRRPLLEARAALLTARESEAPG